MNRFIWGLFLAFFSTLASAEISTECKDDQECLIEVPGAICADGTPSFFTLTRRANASRVLIYLSGGGGCWNKETCEKGYASPLTRKETPTDWNGGPGIFNRNDSKNPFGHGYNVITVPYCTGDVYTGNSDANYGTAGAPYVIRHQGYQNVKKVLAAVKELYPSPEKVVMLGCSAGGIGALYHLRNLDAAFPSSRKYVVSDAGTPFKPPYLKAAKYQLVMKNWGAEGTLPTSVEGHVLPDFGKIVQDNTRRFSDIRFGFISSYRDRTMTFFALAVGSPSPFTAVRDNIIDVANNDIGDSSNGGVFYTDSNIHCHTPFALGGITSLGENLGDWLGHMTEDSQAWKSVRPDKQRSVPAAWDMGEIQYLH